MASEAEENMRCAVEAHIHALLPDARVIHELECGCNRADMAAMTPDRLFLFELKSENDKLDRLDNQMNTFAACAHLAVAVLDQKFFDYSPYTNGADRCAGPSLGAGTRTWRYPGPPVGTLTEHIYEWTLGAIDDLTAPAPRGILSLMYADEQRAVLRRHGLPVNGPQAERVRRMAFHLTGKEIAEETCRELRGRIVLRGDPPMSQIEREEKTDG